MADRPNILLITTDQQRFDTIHHAGNDRIFTPHLNWLMGRGVCFDRCYSDSPVCIPARATIMTGRHGYSNHLTTYATSPVPMAEYPTLPGVLARHGYQTRAAGKMHFHPVRACYGFEHMDLPYDYHREMQRNPHRGTPMHHGLGQNEMEPAFATVEERYSQTAWTVDKSIDFLETRDPTRPFFLWTSFAKPHPPFDCDRAYWDLYDGIDPPESVYGDWSKNSEDIHPAFMIYTDMLNEVDRFSPAQLCAAKRAYYACISQIDYNLGRLFARLRDTGQFDNTYILFTSDHGEMLGDHHMGGKGLFLEGSAHVPLLIRPPARDWEPHPQQGVRCDRLVCLADLMPTCLGMAGIEVPAGMDGLDLMEVADGAAGRDELIGHYGPGIAVIEDRLKYLYATNGGAELLFDLAEDPGETRNLMADPSHQKDLERLRRRADQHIGRYAPQWSDRAQAPERTPVRRAPEQRWPGFHSTGVESDTLH